jgi:ankyrin repeat-rich membrane spanning protein
MICGALQTLNEDAFEDVVGDRSDRSPANGPTGEVQLQQLAPICEGSEFGSPIQNNSMHSYDEMFEENNNNLNRFDESPTPASTVILMPHYTPNIDDTQL